jgi:imidazolonepropionase-like amidohydrolase
MTLVDSLRVPCILETVKWLVVLFASACSRAPVRNATVGATHPLLALTHVNVVDVAAAKVIDDQNVIITDGVISAVGSAATTVVPAGARAIDGSGRYVIPGLWDMHVHPFNYVSGRPPNEWYLPRLVAYGVTGARLMWVKPSDLPIVKRWRAEMERGDLVSPRIASVGTIVDGPDGAKPDAFPGPSVQVAATPEQGRQAVRDLQAAGVDFIKPYDRLSPQVYFAITDEARRRNYTVAGHVPWAVSARAASEAGQRSIEHLTMVPVSCSSHEEKLVEESGKNVWGPTQTAEMLDTYDDARCARLAATFVAHHTALDPTLVVLRTFVFANSTEFFTQDPRLADLPDDERKAMNVPGFIEKRRKATSEEIEVSRRAWKATLDLTSFMQKHGVLMLAGTDVSNAFVYPGSSLHDELDLLVEAGLTPAEALQAATINPARYLGIEDHFGAVASGMTADLVVLDGNPLADITQAHRIRDVILGGRVYDRPALDRLAKAAR